MPLPQGRLGGTNFNGALPCGQGITSTLYTFVTVQEGIKQEGTKAPRLGIQTSLSTSETAPQSCSYPLHAVSRTSRPYCEKIYKCFGGEDIAVQVERISPHE
jgi:hypothetical protein